MTLADAEFGKTYIVKALDTNDEELDDFLFTLGLYVGEPVVVVSAVSQSFTVAIRDGRYNIDRNLAAAIEVEAA